VAAAALVIATVLVPVLPAGVNVLVAAAVAVIVGVFNLFGRKEPALGGGAPS
jgi:hypothetical protein